MSKCGHRARGAIGDKLECCLSFGHVRPHKDKHGVMFTDEIPAKPLKLDKGKPRFDLLPARALEEVSKVLAFGANKYSAHGWRQASAEWSRYLAAAGRHWAAFLRGEDNDPETGISHLAHAVCSLSFVLEYQATGTGVDDRYKPPPTPEQVMQRMIENYGVPVREDAGDWATAYDSMAPPSGPELCRETACLNERVDGNDRCVPHILRSWLPPQIIMPKDTTCDHASWHSWCPGCRELYTPPGEPFPPLPKVEDVPGGGPLISDEWHEYTAEQIDEMHAKDARERCTSDDDTCPVHNTHRSMS